MPATGAITIVTGTPFSVTFNNGTATFTIIGANYTSLFVTNAILTAVGGSPNGGYQTVVSSAFTSGNTVVTVTSYSTGTAYPGPATYTTGTGTVILMNNIAVPSTPDNIAVGIGTLSAAAGFFVLINNNTYQVSTNSTSFTAESFGGAQGGATLTGISNGGSGGVTFAVGTGGTIIKTTNGTTWTSVTSPTSNDLTSITFG